jgi:hypothetical protein
MNASLLYPHSQSRSEFSLRVNYLFKWSCYWTYRITGRILAIFSSIFKLLLTSHFPFKLLLLPSHYSLPQIET